MDACNQCLSIKRVKLIAKAHKINSINKTFFTTTCVFILNNVKIRQEQTKAKVNREEREKEKETEKDRDGERHTESERERGYYSLGNEILDSFKCE